MQARERVDRARWHLRYPDPIKMNFGLCMQSLRDSISWKVAVLLAMGGLAMSSMGCRSTCSFQTASHHRRTEHYEQQTKAIEHGIIARPTTDGRGWYSVVFLDMCRIEAVDICHLSRADAIASGRRYLLSVHENRKLDDPTVSSFAADDACEIGSVAYEEY